jgi:hypothetical protein
MGRGRRYDSEPKLNLKKVFAVIIAIVVIIMFIFIIKGLITSETSTGKISSESYFTIYKDNKYGVVSSTGEIVIDPSYEEMITIPNNKNAVFICTYDVDYQTGEYKTKVLNQKNEKIFTQYNKVEAILNKDENNNLVYEQEALKVEQDGKYGLINMTGKEILSVEYDEITPILGIENSYKIKKDGKYGIVDHEGKIVIEPQYMDIDILGEDNKSGFIVKNNQEKYGIVDYSNNLIIDIKYDSIQKVYGNDLYVVTDAGKQKVVKKDGTEILTEGFDEIKQVLSNQENAVIFVKNNKYGIINLSGEILINAEYDELSEAKTGTFIAKQGDNYGIIDINKETKVAFEYNSIVYNKKADIYILEDSNLNSTILNSNLEAQLTGILIELNTEKGYIKIRINEDTRYYNFKFEEKQEKDLYPNRTLFLDKKDGKYGFLDKNGKVVIDYIYDDATEQNSYGFAGVKKDGKWGSIDAKANVVQEPVYNLDEYLLIDFIGRWHLGIDINMNYYNQE